MPQQAQLTCQQARDLDLVDYLASLGYTPAHVRGTDYWYLSPLRVEQHPSFKVSRRLNRWYDHGLGLGGNLVDFGLRYHGCTVPELLQGLAAGGALSLPAVPYLAPLSREERMPKLRVLRQRPLLDSPLCGYLRQRGICLETAAASCAEVTYRLHGREYRAIGFANDAGGFELRSPRFKGSSSPKGITTVDRGAREVLVFEGFLDFLSYQTLHRNKPAAPCDVVVLNSLAFFEKARAFMERHTLIHLYLDNDAAGQKQTRHALALSTRYRDRSCTYRQAKDLNEWLQRQGNSRRKALSSKLG